MHYLSMGPQHSPAGANNLQRIKDTCSTLGISLTLEKTEEPSQCLIFLGITLDIQLMQARLPEDKYINLAVACLIHRCNDTAVFTREYPSQESLQKIPEVTTYWLDQVKQEDLCSRPKKILKFLQDGEN